MGMVSIGKREEWRPFCSYSTFLVQKYHLGVIHVLLDHRIISRSEVPFSHFLVLN